MNLNEISLFLTEEIYLLKEDAIQKQVANRYVTYDSNEKKNESQVQVAEESGQTITENDAASTVLLDFEGEFNQGILIIFQGKEITNDIREFLMKILNAVNCTLKDIALVSEEALKSSNMDPIAHLNPKKMVVFGNLHHPLMKLKKINYSIVQDEMEYFFADELDVLFQNQSQKRQLWETLQLFFNIKKQKK